MNHTRIKELLQATEYGMEATIKGWVKTFRNNQFLAVNDGSSLQNLQVVVDYEQADEQMLRRLTTGAAVAVTGKLVESLGKGQRVEIKAESVESCFLLIHAYQIAAKSNFLFDYHFHQDYNFLL